jgi:hypothetical protein
MRSALPFLTFATLLTTVLLGMSPGASVYAAGAPTAHATTGILTRAGTADPIHPPAPGQGVVPQPSGAKDARFDHGDEDAGGGAGQGPVAAPTPLDAHGAGKLLANFNGVSSLDSAVTNFGAEFEPPDQGLCVGNGFIVEPVNSAFTIYRRSGKVVAGPLNVNVLFDEGLTEFTSDPRCYFDPATHTWFAVILFINDSFDAARTDIAVNSSGDPTTPWTVYHLDATDDGANGSPSHPGCPCLGDQPLLGIDSANLYISTNEFSLLGPEFNGAQIYAVAKKDLVSNSNTVHFVHFDNLSIGGDVAASVQPAINTGKHDGDAAEYFLNAVDQEADTGNRLGVWALTNQHAVEHGKIPTLSSLVITSEAYGVPPGAVQKGATSLLDTGDARMQQVQFIDGKLWGALDTVIQLPNDATPRSGIAWFEVQPHLKGQTIGSAHIRDQGYVAVAGNYLLYPAIQASAEGVVAIVFTLSGADHFGSAAYVVRSDDRHAFGHVKIAADGEGPYFRRSTRWGDYSWATLDPSGKSFWLATEYIPPLASQTVDGRQNWGTRVLEVSTGD